MRNAMTCCIVIASFTRCLQVRRHNIPTEAATAHATRLPYNRGHLDPGTGRVAASGTTVGPRGVG
jgi:hypothetical protein